VTALTSELRRRLAGAVRAVRAVRPAAPQHPLSIAVFPKDSNPYQRNLYDALAQQGVTISYVGAHTGSRTTNLGLLPLELAVRRLRGAQILHLHWVWGFMLTGADRWMPMRRLTGVWYAAILAWARLIGLRIVWTLHNVLPHERLFVDDVAARRRLLRACDLVIAHSEGSLEALTQQVGTPRHACVIPHGPVRDRPTRLERPDGDAPLSLLFFGLVARYKGVEDLLAALIEVAGETTLSLTIAGDCVDAGLRPAVQELAASLPGRVTLRLERIPDDDLETLFAGHDAMILPYRRATTSGAAILGCEMGMPIIISDLPAFRDIPAIRTAPGPEPLAATLRRLDAMDRAELQALGATALEWARQRVTWTDVARHTRAELESLLAPATEPAAVRS
jgi:glycosyltransferase involved in cell wall biosynthesis